MSKSNDNVVYLTQAAKNGGTTQPAKDIGPLSNDEQHLVETYMRLSRQDRTYVQNLLTRWLNSGEYKQQ